MNRHEPTCCCAQLSKMIATVETCIAATDRLARRIGDLECELDRMVRAA